MLMQHERLASLQSQVSADGRQLSVRGPGGESIDAALDGEAALERLASFFARHVGTPLKGVPSLVKARGQRFTDVSVVSPALMNSISLINLATVRELARVLGKDVNPLRFRANVYFDGGAPWEELGWLDKPARLGGLDSRIVMHTLRCAATNVDPETGMRDLSIPQALIRNFRRRQVQAMFEEEGPHLQPLPLTLLGLMANANAAERLAIEVYNPGRASIFPISSEIVTGKNEVVLIDAQFQRNDAETLVQRIKAARSRRRSTSARATPTTTSDSMSFGPPSLT